MSTPGEHADQGSAEGSAHYPSLQDRCVLVTGGATGIGAAVVRAFVGQGSRVAFLDVAEEPAQELVAELGGEPLFLTCDLRDVEALRAAVRTAEERLGPVRALVSNAANDDRHEVADVEPDYWDERMATNLRHHFFAAQAVRPGMAEAGGGAIVNLGSITWRLGFTGLPAYATAKAGILGLTKALARELGPERIRVNCIEPGFVETERQQELWLTPELDQRVRSAQCLPDLCQPEDVADLALFLASDQSARITARSIVIDGGWT